MDTFDLTACPPFDLAPLAAPVQRVVSRPAPWPVAGAAKGSDFAPLGNDGFDAAVKALTAHLVGDDLTTDFDDATQGKRKYYLWVGDVFDADAKGAAAGKFWIPALIRSADLPAIIAKVHAKKRETKPYTTLADAADSVRRWHSGLGASTVAWSICAPVEIDHLPRAEQERRYAALAAATGLQWALQVFTGGKSVHAYLSFDRLLSPNDPLRREIQDLLIAILHGDTKITDVGRIMRVPAWDSGDRLQPIVHLDPTAHYSPLDIVLRLRDYAATLGIGDVAGTIETLRMAERLGHYAAKTDTETATEVRDHAAVLRATSAAPRGDDLALARAMLGDGPLPFAPHGGTPSVGTANGKVYYVAPDVMAPFAAYPKHARVHAPCCASHPKHAGVVLSLTNDGTPRVYCHRCGHTVRATSPVDALDAPDAGVTMDELLADLGGPLTPAERAEHDAAERAADAQERADTDAKKAATARHLAPLADRVARRKAEADALDPALADAARDASKYAKELRPLWWAKYKAGGIVRDSHPCGFSQGISNVVNARTQIQRRGCSSLACYRCGPPLLAAKTAAIATIPLTDHGGAIVGHALDQRAVYLSEIPAIRLAAWIRAFQRATQSEDAKAMPSGITLSYLGLNSISTDPSTTTIDAKAIACGAHGYVAFRGGQTTVVLATLPVSVPKQWRITRANELYDGQDVVRDLIRDLVAATYAVESDEFGKRIMGKITTSENITGNPDTLWRLASGSEWAVEEPRTVSPEEAKKQLDLLGISAEERREEGGTAVQSVVTAPILDVAKRVALWDAVRIDAVGEATDPPIEITDDDLAACGL